jgi:hypothetical protein
VKNHGHEPVPKAHGSKCGRGYEQSGEKDEFKGIFQPEGAVHI